MSRTEKETARWRGVKESCDQTGAKTVHQQTTEPEDGFEGVTGTIPFV